MTFLAILILAAAGFTFIIGTFLVADGGRDWWRGLTLLATALVLLAAVVFVPSLRYTLL